MILKNKLNLTAIIAITSMSLTGCFTGIESTPKITAGDVKRQKAVPTPEMSYTSGVKGDPVSSWRQGKSFYITDSRIALALSPYDVSTSLVEGDMIRYAGMRDVPSMTDIDDTLVMLTTTHGDTLSYRVNAPRLDVESRKSLEIPFTIEQTLIDRADSLMRGNSYFITTPIWFDRKGDNITGRKFVKIIVDSVTAGNANYPLSVNFTDDAGMNSRVFMSTGTSRRASRNFETLFTLTDPRDNYSNITDDVWDCITRSKVKLNMTRQQCRLSLGNPSEVIHGHYVERWSYDSGLILIFDDGFLTHIGHTPS